MNEIEVLKNIYKSKEEAKERLSEEEKKKSEELLKTYGYVGRYKWMDNEGYLISRNVFNLLKDKINLLFVGTSVEDYRAYELEEEVGRILEFLRKDNIRCAELIVNDNDLISALELDYLAYYDAKWHFYVTTKIDVFEELLKNADDKGLISIELAREIVTKY